MDDLRQIQLFEEDAGEISLLEDPRRGCTSAPPGGRLAEYVKHFATVEIDSTFYGTPRRSTVERWGRIAPEGFLFAAKFPQQTEGRNDIGAGACHVRSGGEPHQYPAVGKQ